jgi:2'-5' RNA ligase
LFTGIELDDAVRTGAGVLSAELQKRVQAQAPRARITWIPADRMHLTVRFIGEVGDAIAERVIGALREPLRVQPFVIGFDRFGAFPPKGPSRVIWIGVAEGRDAAVRAETAISDRLAALDIPRDDRAYSPHLTLARIRDAAGLRTASLFDGLAPRLGQTHVSAITLFQSKLSPKGPTYVVLQRTSLRDG